MPLRIQIISPDTFDRINGVLRPMRTALEAITAHLGEPSRRINAITAPLTKPPRAALPPKPGQPAAIVEPIDRTARAAPPDLLREPLRAKLHQAQWLLEMAGEYVAEDDADSPRRVEAIFMIVEQSLEELKEAMALHLSSGAHRAG